SALRVSRTQRSRHPRRNGFPDPRPASGGGTVWYEKRKYEHEIRQSDPTASEPDLQDLPLARRHIYPTSASGHFLVRASKVPLGKTLPSSVPAKPDRENRA